MAVKLYLHTINTFLDVVLLNDGPQTHFQDIVLH